MAKTFRSAVMAVSLLTAATVVLTGCGRKGELDRPSTPVAEQNKRDSTVQPTPSRPFLLDPLL
ncbi:lipoprotein [Peteryoungia desertarenae]|uniref:Lipoprotein n=1 Tax=Peteryoungia desertarenae TaxID=1813451 RepID=A0ABX6QJC6_9HYPH|nr:lipoprotein [Peteryoungia desertarenae]QLF68577.1 lipoprotein [Peteryoungia desertarenae]